MGTLALEPRDAHSTHPANGDATADAFLASFPSLAHFLNPMRISPRPAFPLFALIVLLGASLACSQSLSAAPPSAATEPPQSVPYSAVLPTSELPSEGAATPVVNPPQPMIPETRRLTLEFPPSIRAGDADTIRLTLEVDNLGNLTPTAILEGNVVTGQTVQIPNLYDTHKVIAEARLDLAGVEMSPSETISEPLYPGQSVTFYWSVRPQEVGDYRGTVWLHLRFVPKNGGEEERRAISAQPIEIHATTFLGLSGSLARSAGGVGSVIGAVAGFPFFEDIVKYLFRKRRRL